jgi:hypothetical protein
MSKEKEFDKNRNVPDMNRDEFEENEINFAIFSMRWDAK